MKYNFCIILTTSSLELNVLISDMHRSVSKSLDQTHSDFHFFGMPIPSDFRLYVLADMQSTAMFPTIKLGGCRAERSPDTISGPGVQEMSAATDEELQQWLMANEAQFEDSNKLCAEEMLTATRVKSPPEWGSFGLSENYSLFEWSLPPMRMSDESKTFNHFYIRANLQKTSFSGKSGHINVTESVEIHDVWLIATNIQINFSMRWILKDKADPFTNGGDEDCNTGIH